MEEQIGAIIKQKASRPSAFLGRGECLMLAVFWVALLLGRADAQADLVGAWEGCQSEFGVLVEHFYIEFNGDGSFRRVALRDDPERPVAEDRGRYEGTEGVVTLRYAAASGGVLVEHREPVLFALAGDTLHWGAEPAIALTRAQPVGDALLGRWGIVNFADGTLAGHVAFRADATYELELGGVGHSGVWARAGSGVVHWPTSADGLPAVWTNVRVAGDQLYYDIACNFTIEAVRLATAVAEASWGAIKRQLAGRSK